MKDLKAFRNVMFVYIVLMGLIMLLAFLLSGCAIHSGTVLFKGYQPLGYRMGYRPNKHGTGIIKGLVAIDESYYVILKEGDDYNKIEITKEKYKEIKKGDNYSKKVYLWSVEEWSVEKGKAVEELFEQEKQAQGE